MKKKKQDYKDYIYLRIPKEEYKKIIEKKRKITTKEIEEWRFNYELKQSKKNTKRANEIKKYRTAKKIYEALENYYLNLFTSEKENLTIYKLAKLAKVSYPTAKKFWQTHNLSYWIQNFKYKKQEALNNFKIIELTKELIAL